MPTPMSTSAARPPTTPPTIGPTLVSFFEPLCSDDGVADARDVSVTVFTLALPSPDEVERTMVVLPIMLVDGDWVMLDESRELSEVVDVVLEEDEVDVADSDDVSTAPCSDAAEELSADAVVSPASYP